MNHHQRQRGRAWWKERKSGQKGLGFYPKSIWQLISSGKFHSTFLLTLVGVDYKFLLADVNTNRTKLDAGVINQLKAKNTIVSSELNLHSLLPISKDRKQSHAVILLRVVFFPL